MQDLPFQTRVVYDLIFNRVSCLPSYRWESSNIEKPSHSRKVSNRTGDKRQGQALWCPTQIPQNPCTGGFIWPWGLSQGVTVNNSANLSPSCNMSSLGELGLVASLLWASVSPIMTWESWTRLALPNIFSRRTFSNKILHGNQYFNRFSGSVLVETGPSHTKTPEEILEDFSNSFLVCVLYGTFVTWGSIV